MNQHRHVPLSERSFPGTQATDRGTFLMRTYGHLLGAVLALTLVEVVLFKTGMAAKIFATMMSAPWLLWLGLFMVAGYIATRFAAGAKSLTSQYLGLSIYVVAQAIILLPLLFIANAKAAGVIQSAAFVTAVGFTALTAVVMVTRKDFSFMRSVLMWASFAALGFIVVGAIMGFHGGVIFPMLMIALAGGWILHDTSKVLLHYPEDRYVGASLELFASVSLLFYYVLMLFLDRD